MKNKKTNKIVLVMAGLTAVSGGLFAYQNIYLVKQNPEQVIFIAKDNIPAQSEIKEDMLKAVAIPSSGVLPNYVTNKNELVGKRLLGGLLKDEPLSKNRLVEEKDLKHQLELKIDYDNNVPLANGDYINIYVILQSNGGTVNVQKLFERKLITTTTATTGDASSAYYSIKVNEEEAIAYYDAREKGKLVVVKDKSLDGKEDISTKKYDANSEEAQNAVKPNDKTNGDGMSIVTKTFEEKDKLEDLAREYKTDVATIKKLNNDKSDFKAGDQINLPAN